MRRRRFIGGRRKTLSKAECTFLRWIRRERPRGLLEIRLFQGPEASPVDPKKRRDYFKDLVALVTSAEVARMDISMATQESPRTVVSMSASWSEL